MRFTTIALALDAATVFTAWQSGISLAAKVILTVLLVGHLLGSFYLTCMAGEKWGKKVWSVVLTGTYAAIVTYALVNEAARLSIVSGVAFVIWTVWACAAVFCIGVRKNKDK